MLEFLRLCTAGAILALANPAAWSASPLQAWVHRYGNVLTNSQDTAVKAVVDPNGDLIVVGAVTDQSTGSDILTLKYAGGTGTMPATLLWEGRYDGPTHNNDVPAGVAVDSQGNILITGSSLDEQGDPDGVTIKYAGATGALLWEKRFVGAPNTRQELHAVAVDGNGNVFVTGYSVKTIYPDIYTAKYSASGELLWEKVYDSSDKSWDEATSIAVDAAGNAVVAGFSAESDGYFDFYAAKYAAANGALQWQRRYQGQAHGHHNFYAVAIDSNNDVVAAGSTSSTEGGTYAQGFYTVKFSGVDGATRWNKTYTGPANAGGVATALAVDANNDVITTGVIWDPSVSDAYTAKYSASDGRLLWERSYNGANNKEDATHAVAMAPNGDVLVTGYSDRSGATAADYFTACYAANDGRTLWERHYDGPSSWEDQSTAVAVDGSGDVFVTGFVSAPPYSTDCYTVKYQGLNGSTLWDITYRGTAQSDESQPTVALDENGNVLMAGLSSYQGASGYYAAKYAATTGTLLWETRYDDYPFEQAQAVTVHGGTAVAFAGFSWPNGDRYVAKLAGNNGTV
ncbi:MAG TPA: SBBP repeat-containing protein, partial [Candidatus Dormibacteraeota bacterium]|nr:SBBP repeat-containing protein [Candidatus Dormibacteraeota bacterium]